MQAVFVYDFEMFKAPPGLLCVKRDRNLASSTCCCCHQIGAGLSHIMQAVFIDTSVTSHITLSNSTPGLIRAKDLELANSSARLPQIVQAVV